MPSAACVLCAVMMGVLLVAAEKEAFRHLGSKHRRSMKTLPREGDMPAEDLRRFYAGIAELQDTGRRLTSVSGVYFHYENVSAELVTRDTNMPEELQGIWLMANHPTLGDTLVTFWGGIETFRGAFGEDLPHDSANNVPGYTYASVKTPRTLAVAKNNHEALHYLHWFHGHGMEFNFPDWGVQPLKEGDASWINTHMEGGYENYPVPGAILEGWDGNSIKFVRWNLDPKKETDPAKCFCSVIYRGNGIVDRNNFGEFGYKMYQIVDASGNRTQHWDYFTTRMADQGITEFFTTDPNGTDAIDAATRMAKAVSGILAVLTTLLAVHV